VDGRRRLPPPVLSQEPNGRAAVSKTACSGFDSRLGRVDVVTRTDRLDLTDEAQVVFRTRWPEFIFHDAVTNAHMARVAEHFFGYDILVLDDGAVVAGGWGVPFAWDGTYEGLPDGYVGALVRAVRGRETGTAPTAFSFMAAAVAPSHDRRGLARFVLGELARRAAADGIPTVVAPLRPTWKHRYPTFSMAEYATWVRPDGLSIDPWIRTHQRMGARVLGPAPRSMTVEGTVAEWETWADMPFPVSSAYVVPDALNLVHIDRERDRGVYVEENLWVEHPRV
jgi:GNAT superfamily N-acetyltransferase